MEFVAKLPRTGYCVATNGDKIPLTVDVQNNSTRLIKMKAKINQQVTMSNGNAVHISSKSMSLTKISSEIIQPGASYVWSPANWIVPPTFPTTLLGCMQDSSCGILFGGFCSHTKSYKFAMHYSHFHW